MDLKNFAHKTIIEEQQQYFKKTAMKKTAVILILFVVITSGCKCNKSTAQSDSLNIEQELILEQIDDLSELLDKYYPLISSKDAEIIAPAIKKWTDFYSIDFLQARLVRKDSICFNCSPDTTSMYYREFTHKHNSDKRIDADYSPDKQLYIDLGIGGGTYYNEEDKKYYFIGWDDCQEIYLIDRKQKHLNMIIWLGAASLAEAVFWKSNDLFIIAGYDKGYSDGILRFVYVFDIKEKMQYRYEIATDAKSDDDQYMNEIYLKEKGIFVSN